MMRTKKILVILAAGIGSRFVGGIKQLHSVGPAGECIMDFSIYDALDVGFNRIVFIIRKDIEELFTALIGNRIHRICSARNVEVLYVFQDICNLPRDYECPVKRIKPWGTVHALLSCKNTLSDKFVVINADDYYGRDSFSQMAMFLDALDDHSTGFYAMAGFPLSNTLSEYGGVTRGLCSMDKQNYLSGIRETRSILKSSQGPYIETPNGPSFLDGNALVSMNMWAFTPDILDLLENQFTQFLASGGLEFTSSEFPIPTAINSLLLYGIRVQVLLTSSKWFGMTFSEEVPTIRQYLSQLTEHGVYPSPLFPD